MLKRFSFLLLFILPATAFAQSKGTIKVMEYVKIENDHFEEALFYYENNWKHLRDVARDQGHISGYELLTVSDADYDIILITEYSNTEQFNASEPNFQKIIQQELPKGPTFMNNLRPADFRKNLNVTISKVRLSSEDS